MPSLEGQSQENPPSPDRGETLPHKSPGTYERLTDMIESLEEIGTTLNSLHLQDDTGQLLAYTINPEILKSGGEGTEENPLQVSQTAGTEPFQLTNSDERLEARRTLLETFLDTVAEETSENQASASIETPLAEMTEENLRNELKAARQNATVTFIKEHLTKVATAECRISDVLRGVQNQLDPTKNLTDQEKNQLKETLDKLELSDELEKDVRSLITQEKRKIQEWNDAQPVEIALPGKESDNTWENLQQIQSLTNADHLLEAVDAIHPLSINPDNNTISLKPQDEEEVREIARRIHSQLVEEKGWQADQPESNVETIYDALIPRLVSNYEAENNIETLRMEFLTNDFVPKAFGLREEDTVEFIEEDEDSNFVFKVNFDSEGKNRAPVFITVSRVDFKSLPGNERNDYARASENQDMIKQGVKELETPITVHWTTYIATDPFEKNRIYRFDKNTIRPTIPDEPTKPFRRNEYGLNVPDQKAMALLSLLEATQLQISLQEGLTHNKAFRPENGFPVHIHYAAARYALPIDPFAITTNSDDERVANIHLKATAEAITKREKQLFESLETISEEIEFPDKILERISTKITDITTLAGTIQNSTGENEPTSEQIESQRTELKSSLQEAVTEIQDHLADSLLEGFIEDDELKTLPQGLLESAMDRCTQSIQTKKYQPNEELYNLVQNLVRINRELVMRSPNSSPVDKALAEIYCEYPGRYIGRNGPLKSKLNDDIQKTRIQLKSLTDLRKYVLQQNPGVSFGSEEYRSLYDKAQELKYTLMRELPRLTVSEVNCTRNNKLYHQYVDQDETPESSVTPDTVEEIPDWERDDWDSPRL